MDCKYSILIPTFNRKKYLENTIKTILNQKYNNYELIISDSGSTDDTWNYLSQLNNSNLKIFKPTKKLSEVENFEYIISKAKGEWVILIGDDDGVLPDFFINLDKIIEKYPDAEAISSNAGFYYHENVKDLYGNRVISYNHLSNKIAKKNSNISLLFCILGIYSRLDVPMLYTTGVVKRSLIEKIKKKGLNKIFHSIIEDYYSMVAILFETKYYIKSYKPLFWVGTSKSSSGRGLAVYENNKNVDHYLRLSENISENLHKVGISSIYFLEAIFKHPYISKIWKSKFIYTLALVYAYKDIKERKDFDRIKNQLDTDKILLEILVQVEKNRISKFSFFSLKYILDIVFLIKKIFKIILKIFTFFKKKIFKKLFFDINSNDREKYYNIPICNQILEDLIKNKKN